VACGEGLEAVCSKDSNAWSACSCQGRPDGVVESGAIDSNTPVATTITTNAVAQLNQKLASVRDYQLSQACRKVSRSDCAIEAFECPQIAACPRPEGPRCHTHWEDVCDRIIGKLTVTGTPFIEKSIDVKVEKPDWNALPPAEIVGLRETYTNCLTEKQSQTFTFSKVITTGSEVTKTQTVADAGDINIDVGFNFVWFSSKVNARFNHSVSVSEAKRETYTQSETASVNLPIIIDPMTKVFLERSWIVRRIPVVFSGTVQLNAAVGPNLEGIGTVSQVVQSQLDRTFSFAGVVEDVTLYEGTTAVTGVGLKELDCPVPTLSKTSELLH
jgi:hypothetical protein